MRALSLVVIFHLTALIVRGHVSDSHDTQTHGLGEGGCGTLPNQKMTVSAYYRTKPKCSVVRQNDLISRYKKELRQICHQRQCCEVTNNISSSCGAASDMDIEVVLKIDCCCSAFTLKQLYCETQMDRIVTRIRNKKIFRLRMKPIRGNRQTVKLFRYDVSILASKPTCSDGYKPSADGFTCQPCPPVTFLCQEHREAPVCSSHGVCECGRCHCNSDWSGEFCQCSNSSCPSGATNQSCSDHGSCECGQCVCNRTWHGTACECSDSDCPRSPDGRVCSGHGTCHCGRCDCEEHTVGNACETCLQAVTGRNGSIDLSNLNNHHHECDYSICSSDENRNVLLAIQFTDNQTCQHLEILVSDEMCTEAIDHHHSNNTILVECNQTWFYRSNRNCLCISVHNDDHLELQAKGVKALFVTFDGRLFSRVLDYAIERGLLDRFMQDDISWSHAVMMLNDSNITVSYPAVQAFASQLPTYLLDPLT